MALLFVSPTILFVMGTNKSPLEPNVVEVVDDFLTLIDGERDFLLARGFVGLESVGGRADFRTEINLRRLEDLVRAKPTILLDYNLDLKRNRAEEIEEN